VQAASSQPRRALLHATFSPERLGSPTTVGFALSIDPPPAGPLPPVSSVQVRYPANLGLLTSGLGLETCQPTTLETQGPKACPPDALMGAGSAVVEVAFGPEIVTENVALEIYAAPSDDGYIHLAILAHGGEPVLANLVLPGVIEPGQLDITVPAIDSLPGAPSAALVTMHAQLGGQLTYYEQRHGRTIAYHPRGIGLPDSCPRGGFRLAVTVNFTDRQSTRAGARVPCPTSRPARRQR